MSKKEEIKELVIEALDRSVNIIKDELIDKVLNSGCVDVASWDKESNPMILPKSILIALLENEANQYSAKGTCFEKELKTEVRNIQRFV